LGALALTAHAQASLTLPSGFDTVEGNNGFWAGFDPSAVPARAGFYFDQAVFPWGTKAHTIHQLAIRVDGTSLAYTKHQKRLRVFLSTNAGGTARRPRLVFDTAHGRDRTLVVGSPSAPATIQFDVPTKRGPAPFSVVLKLNQAFVVPANARNLFLEIRTYDASPATASWLADAQFTMSGLSGGSITNFGHPCPIDYPIDALAAWPGGDLVTSCRPKSPGVPVIAWLGEKLPAPATLPGTQGACDLYVFPRVVVGRVSGTDSTNQYETWFEWGPLPNDERLVGARVGIQAAVVKAPNPFLGAVGISRGYEVVLGGGYDSKVQASMIYAAGVTVNPDTTSRAEFLSSRALILEVR